MRRAYPDAPEMVTSLLVRDQFVDPLGDVQLQVYVKQAHAADLQEALARTLKFESFVASSGTMRRVADRGQEFWARRSGIQKQSTGTKAGGFAGTGWECEQQGHMKRDCPEWWRPQSQERQRPYESQPGCWGCGQHFSALCPQPKSADTPSSPENDSRLGTGALSQPVAPRPHSH